MVWWVTTIRSGGETHDAVPYETKDDALNVVKAEHNSRAIDSAYIEDHDGNRVEWPEIKQALGLV